MPRSARPGDQLGAVVHAGGSHEFGQPPGVIDLSLHEVSSSSVNDCASGMVVSRTRRRVLMR